MNPSELHILVWSHTQQCFHYETFRETVSLGIEAYLLNEPQDYVVVGVAASREKIREIRLMLESKKTAIAHSSYFGEN